MTEPILVIHPPEEFPKELADLLESVNIMSDFADFHQIQSGQVYTTARDVTLLWSSTFTSEAGEMLRLLGAKTERGFSTALILMAPVLDARTREEFFESGLDDVLPLDTSATELLHKVAKYRKANLTTERLGYATSELTRTTTLLDKAQGLKNHFLSRITHDIRTPMTTLKLCSELLGNIAHESTSTPQKVGDIISVLMRSIQRVETVFRELTTISRLDVEDLRLQCRLVDLNLSVTEAVAECFSEAMQQQVVLDVQNTDLPPIWADAQRIRQMLTNMIALSLIRSEPKGQILLETMRDDSGLRCSIRDEGPKVADMVLSEIMKGLSEDEPTMETRVELYVIHRIAEAHGGTMRYTPLPRGMELSVWLPLDQETINTGDIS